MRLIQRAVKPEEVFLQTAISFLDCREQKISGLFLQQGFYTQHERHTTDRVWISTCHCFPKKKRSLYFICGSN